MRLKLIQRPRFEFDRVHTHQEIWLRIPDNVDVDYSENVNGSWLIHFKAVPLLYRVRWAVFRFWSRVRCGIKDRYLGAKARLYRHFPRTAAFSPYKPSGKDLQ